MAVLFPVVVVVIGDMGPRVRWSKERTWEEQLPTEASEGESRDLVSASRAAMSAGDKVMSPSSGS
jgi:hypothetical protein